MSKKSDLPTFHVYSRYSELLLPFNMFTVSDNFEAPISDDAPPLEINNIKGKGPVIPSGSFLQVIPDYEWIYIPFNHKYTQRNNQLVNLLTKAGINVDKLKNDPKYTVDKINLMRADIQTIYNKVEGNINQNSMIVYSGPKGDWHSLPHYYLFSEYGKFRNRFNYYPVEIACIYTGDADLKITRIDSIFKNFWINIGSIQIPHHGSKNGFNKDVLHNHGLFYPISVGKNNTYDHPSKNVLLDILRSGGIPVIINEDLSTKFVQVFKLHSK